MEEKEEVQKLVRAIRDRAAGLGLGSRKKTDTAPARVMSDDADLAPDTLRTYQRIFKEHIEKGRGLDEVKRPSWNVHRAAILHGYREEYRGLMKAQSNAQREWLWSSARMMAEEAKNVLDRIEETLAAEKPAMPEKRKTKRNRIPPEGWQAKTLHVANPEHEQAVVGILWATGCRPLELERGVVLERSKDGILARIDGAKTSRKTGGGQGIRVLTIDPESAPGMALESMLKGQGRVTVQIERRALEKALERIGRHAGLKQRLSAYNYRHAVSASLKTQHDTELTAVALGHVSTKSQQRYGTARQAQGKSAITNAKGTRSVRQTRSPNSRSPQKNEGPEPG